MATRLRTQYLLAFALAALVPVAVLGLVEFVLFQRALPEREQEMLDDHLRLADLLASNLRYELNLVLDPVQKAADLRSALTRQNSAGQDGALARLMSTTPLFRHLLLVDGRRRVIASAKPTLWRGQVLPASVFPIGGAAGPVYYSPVFASIYDGAPLAAIAVAYPTFERGALVSLLDLGIIESQVRTQSTANRRIWVVDRTGRPLAHAQGQLAPSSTALADLPPVRQVLKNQRGTVRYEQSVDGERVEQLAAFAPSVRGDARAHRRGGGGQPPPACQPHRRKRQARTGHRSDRRRGAGLRCVRAPAHCQPGALVAIGQPAGHPGPLAGTAAARRPR
ncbi:cache domain-containing protein [Gloeobacter morelensis]|uniref:cache domain-containing protein n=1 Tax=Gloeobacter morelensis TaxID=2907343 RepID=UPI001E4DB5F9|nr:cache domain-containing protein [Gloeobacter morelensis]